jgi:hypothetical protein
MGKSVVERLVFGTEQECADWLARRDDATDLSQREVERALFELSALTRMLLERLEAAGLVDRSELRMVLEPRQAVTYRGSPQTADTVRCAACRTSVPRTLSFMSSRGELCTACHELEVAREEREERARRES